MSDNTERNAEIVRRRMAGEYPHVIAADMGLTRNTVIGVCHRAGVHNFDHVRACCAKRSALTPEFVREIRARHTPYHAQDGTAALAREFGVHTRTVGKVVACASWKHVA